MNLLSGTQSMSSDSGSSVQVNQANTAKTNFNSSQSSKPPVSFASFLKRNADEPLPADTPTEDASLLNTKIQQNLKKITTQDADTLDTSPWAALGMLTPPDIGTTALDKTRLTDTPFTAGNLTPTNSNPTTFALSGEELNSDPLSLSLLTPENANNDTQATLLADAGDSDIHQGLLNDAVSTRTLLNQQLADNSQKVMAQNYGFDSSKSVEATAFLHAQLLDKKGALPSLDSVAVESSDISSITSVNSSATGAFSGMMTSHSGLLGGVSNATTTSSLNTMPEHLPEAVLNDEGFDDAVGAQLTWLAEQKIGRAHIRVSPQSLGPVEIQLRLDGDKIFADFSSANQDVRHALQNSLPHLRELLGQQGFELAQADIGQQSNQAFSDSSNHSDRSNATAIASDNQDNSESISTTNEITNIRQLTQRGLLDTYV